MSIFVYELFETMQSSVTKSKTFATKSLPASFKYCNYLLIYSKLQQNTKFHALKPTVSSGETTDEEERRKRRGIMKQSLHIIGYMQKNC